MSDATATAPPADLESINLRIREIMDAEGRTKTQLAGECGIPMGTFTQVLTGQYKGKIDDRLRQIDMWLSTRSSGARLSAMVPSVPAFLPTPTGRFFLGTMEHAQHMPDFSVITGAPGTGKTSAIKHYRRNNPNVHLATAAPSGTTPGAMLEAIGFAMGINGSGVLSYRLAREIIARLTDTRALLVVDEAQHLESRALDELRTIYDLAGVGVVVSGNESVLTKLQGGSRAKEFAQLFRRVGMRAHRDKPSVNDIAVLLDAWGIEDAEVRELLAAIGAKPGALGQMVKVLKYAHMQAAGDAKGDSVTKAHVTAAWNTLSNNASLSAPEQPMRISTPRRVAPRLVGDAA